MLRVEDEFVVFETRPSSFSQLLEASPANQAHEEAPSLTLLRAVFFPHIVFLQFNTLPGRGLFFRAGCIHCFVLKRLFATSLDTCRSSHDWARLRDPWKLCRFPLADCAD